MTSAIPAHRRFFAEYLVKSAGSSNQQLVGAFAAVPREDFLGPGPWQICVADGYISTITDDPAVLYQDILVALAPDRGINNGQPSLHAECLAAVAPVAGESVAHFGAGAGYYSAILATLVGSAGHVLVVEIERDLADQARANLSAFPNVEVLNTSAMAIMLPKRDIIYVNAGATRPPTSWLDALRIGGRLVFPLTATNGLGVMLLIKRVSETAFAATVLRRVGFIPCIGAQDDMSAESLPKVLEQRAFSEVRSLHLNTRPDTTAWHIGSDWWLSTVKP